MVTQLQPNDEELIKESSRLRFAQIMFGTAGGAILFGLVSTVSGIFITMVKDAAIVGTLGSAGLLPMLGLAVIAVGGIASIYMGARYLSKSLVLDQHSQANKIAQATDGRATTIDAPARATAKTTPFSDVQEQQAQAPAEAQAGKQWAASVANARAPGASWKDRALEPSPSAAATLH